MNIKITKHDLKNLFFKYFIITEFILLLVSPLISFLCTEITSGNNFEYLNQTKFIYNYICYAFIYAFVYIITLKPLFTICFCSVLLYIVGLANAFVLAFRGSPILPFDLISAKTAMSVAGNYSYKITKSMIYGGLIVLSLIILEIIFHFIGKFLLGKLNKTSEKPPLKKRVINGLCIRGIMLLIYIGLLSPSLYLVQRTDFLTEHYVYLNIWNQTSGYKNAGFLLSFVANTKYFFVDKPENYSVKALEPVIEELKTEVSNNPSTSSVTNPNIIVIMNESFSELQAIAEFETSEEYMPFINNFTENTIRGNLSVSIHGGNTCNTEFEFLTGNSMSFLPVGSVPFQQYMGKKQYTICSILKENNYSEVAIHPYDASGWNRNTVYPHIGFDKFLSLSDFEDKEYIRYYISDKCDFNKVIEEFENRDKNNPFFLFNVTMQNHGGFGNANNRYEYTNNVTLNDYEGYDDVEEYLSLIQDTDEAYEDLISYFKGVSEPTIILFFGDHQPNIGSEFYEELYGKSLNDLSLEELQKKFQVPFIIWANYDIEEKYYEHLSCNYLNSLLLDTAGIKVPLYNKYLLKLSETLPVINVNGYQDSEGNHYSYDEETPYSYLIDQYHMFQYNNMFDNSNRLNDFFGSTDY